MKKIQEYMKNHYFVLMVSLMMAMNALAEVTWNGTSSTSWTQGDGTEANPYIISSPNHLKYLSTQVNAGTTYTGVYFKQTQDFDLNKRAWVSIGTDVYRFNGVYDGGDHYITNLNKTTLFGSIYDATIKNITLQGEVSRNVVNYTTEAITYGLVNKTTGTCRLINCHNNTVINSSTIDHTALVITAAGKTILNRCSFSGGGFVSAFFRTVNDTVEMAECSCYVAPGTKYGVSSFVAYEFGSNGYCNVESCAFVDDRNGGSSHLSYSGSNQLISFKGCYFRRGITRNTYTTNYNFHDCYMTGGGAFSSNSASSWKAYNCYSPSENTAVPGVMVYTTGQMKTEKFVEELNKFNDYFVTDYEGINDGYPILKWQAGTRYALTGTCDANRGTVTGGGEYPNGYVATLTATPKNGCTFVGWSDGNTDNPRTVTVSGNANYTAQFTKSSYTIYVNQDGTSNIE